MEWQQIKYNPNIVFSEKCVIDFDINMASHFQ